MRGVERNRFAVGTSEVTVERNRIAVGTSAVAGLGLTFKAEGFLPAGAATNYFQSQ